MQDPRPIVLLVEDDHSIANLYSIKLRMDGYRVDIANDAATAGLLFDRSLPDVVCVDSRLPDGSGRDVVTSMVGRGSAVVLLTNDQESYQRPPAGVAAALLKWKTTPAALSAAISRLVGAKKAG
ncbi:MAG: response regulator [Candidatus Dormibacteraeota bacterium]|nr:response regulator [Candidatus Dormibacteraeota bacterium]